MAQPLVKKDDDRDDEAEYSPFLGIEKGAVLQEARVFNDPQLDARRCSQVITKLLYLLNQGETFTKVEATEVFFAVTKLFQSRDIGLRRMVYLMIKELSPSADEVIIVTSSLMKDMNSKTDMYRANAIRVLCRITDGTLLTQIERYLKQAIVDKNPVVASAALVSGIHLLQTNPEIVKRWSNEVQEAVQSRAALVQFHALGLLHQIRQNDRLAVSKLVTSLTRGTVRSPLAQCLLIRYTSQVIRESATSTQTGDRPFYDFLEGCLRHKAEMVIFEAARAITELSGVTSRELTPAITVLQLFLSSSKPVLRFAAVRTLNKVAMTHPMAVTNCNIDMESLISDQNRSIATLAITTLLKTGNESSVERLMKQITNFMSDIADEFKIVVVEAIRSLCLKFPLKYRSLMNFLSNILREEGGFEYKKAIVDSIVILIRDIPDAKESGLLHLCEFIEDCEFTYLSTQILHFLGIEGPKTSDPSKYIRYIYNRVHLENATVRASAVSTLAKFGAMVDSLKPRVFVLLRRCLFDSDDELLLDLFNFSAAGVLALARYPVSDDKLLMDSVEKYISEQLNLTKDSISEVKRIGSVGTEVVKVIQVVIDAVIRLCGVYSEAVNWKFCDGNPEEEKDCIDFEVASNMSHVSNIIKCTIEKLCELGVLAANDGGRLVSILNVSWKGVVALLQLGKGALAVKVNVADIILNLLSLVNESLRCAAKAWSSSLKETVSVTEARRTFVPIKFYLVNAVKISSLYPSQAYLVYREITLCILVISTLKISMSNEELTKTASEVITELLEQTSMDFLKSLLNSVQVKLELKLRILDWLFTDESYSNSDNGGLSNNCGIAPIYQIVSVGCEDMAGARILLLGRVALFLNLLKYSLDLDEDVKRGMTGKLGWFLDILVDEDVYSSILVMQIPELYGSGKTVEIDWQPMFSSVLHALETFMIVLSSSLAWRELESFLLENFFHPHFLCWEIVTELWCFMVRHAEISLVNGIIDQLCSLLKLVASSESVFIPGSAMRKMARSISMIITHGTQSMVDHVYRSIVDDNRSQLSSVICVALLIEGFPLNLLSDRMRSIATQRICTDYFGFLESFDDKLMRACNAGLYGVPVFALSASLQSVQFSMPDIDAKTLKFLVAISHNYRNSVDQLTKEHYRKLLSETLGIISSMKHLYAADEMEEVILELENLFISGPAASDTQLYQCKPNLALFMAGLGHMEITESDKSAKCCAVWELHHMLLREQHWALIHLAITAFGYFAARTSCNQLWRFVPQTAALSFDLVSGNEANEERFMSELKAFLEKEMALLTISPSSEQLGLLAREGLMLKEMVRKISEIDIEAVGCQSMEIDEENQSNKKRKLPDGINEGVELLQSGLKVIGDGLSRWQQNHDANELHDKFLTHISHLEDAIAQLVGLAGSG